MRLQINLRGDLAELNDQELSKRLDEAWQAYGTSTGDAGFKVWASWRGPIRHPQAYRFTSFVGVSSKWSLWSWGGPFFACNGVWMRTHPHLIACEIKDLYDEIQRRVELRHPTGADLC
jgi:hypothetical protein